MQDKTTTLTDTPLQVGLNIHTEKTKIMRKNARDSSLKEVESSTHLRSIINMEGGTDAEVNAVIGKDSLITAQ